MKTASLIIGILLMVLAGIGCVVILMLPALTNNRINFGEAMVGFVPAIIVLIFGFLVTVISTVLILKARKPVTP